MRLNQALRILRDTSHAAITSIGMNLIIGLGPASTTRLRSARCKQANLYASDDAGAAKILGLPRNASSLVSSWSGRPVIDSLLPTVCGFMYCGGVPTSLRGLRLLAKVSVWVPQLFLILSKLQHLTLLTNRRGRTCNVRTAPVPLPSKIRKRLLVDRSTTSRIHHGWLWHLF